MKSSDVSLQSSFVTNHEWKFPCTNTFNASGLNLDPLQVAHKKPLRYLAMKTLTCILYFISSSIAKRPLTPKNSLLPFQMASRSSLPRSFHGVCKSIFLFFTKSKKQFFAFFCAWHGEWIQRTLCNGQSWIGYDFGFINIKNITKAFARRAGAHGTVETEQTRTGCWRSVSTHRASCFFA